MDSIAPGDVVVGVDTHKDTHVAFACDGLGRALDDIEISATNDGYGELLRWALAMGTVYGFGVEGTGSYGVGLARFLRRHDQRVIEVSRSPRAGARRLSGKSDVIDAEHAARAVLAGTATAVPKLADGQVESIRVLKIVRDTAVKAKKSAMIALKATLVTADHDVRARLEYSPTIGSSWRAPTSRRRPISPILTLQCCTRSTRSQRAGSTFTRRSRSTRGI